MQPKKPQKPGSAPSNNRSSSISRFIKKTYPFSSKKERQSTSPPATPEPPSEPEPILGPNGTPPPCIYRPPLQHTPINEVLSTNTTALEAALNDAWPHRHHSRYRDVRALLVCWADNDSAAVNASVPAETFAPLQSPAFQPSSPSVSSLRYSSESETMASLRRVSSRYTMREMPPPTPALNRASSLANLRSHVSTAYQPDMRQGPFIPAAHQLSDVLERRYGITSQIWMIPSLDSPQDVLAAKVKQFVRTHGGPDNLLIFWYGGRAEFVSGSGDGAHGSESGGEVIWYGLRDELGIPARATSKILGDARADVLMLNDSPFAQHAYTSHTFGPGSFELLGSGTMTPSNIELNRAREASFTRNLTLMLDSPFLASRGISVLDLHRKLLDIMSPVNRASVGTTATNTTTTTTSTTTRNGSTSPSADNAATEAETQQRTSGTGTVPRHHRPTSSLVAARAQTVSAANIPTYPVYCQISQSTPLERDARRNIILSRFDAPLAAEGVHAKHAGVLPGVRLDVRLKRPFLDVKKWKEWILRAPSDAQDVSVQILGKKG